MAKEAIEKNKQVAELVKNTSRQTALQSVALTDTVPIGKDFGVMPLEGLWWTEDMKDFTVGNKKNWLWTAMIMQPDVVTEEIFNQAIEQVREKKSPKSLDKLRFASYEEGRSAQVMYVGPYSGEGPTILDLHKFIVDQGGKLEECDKHHHEIYLGDPRRTDPSKLKTIIRQPY
jgi:hypothetical protein